LPTLIQHLPADRERLGLRPVQMAGMLGLTLAEYRALEVGELHITSGLFERICDVCGWPMVGRRDLGNLRHRWTE